MSINIFELDRQIRNEINVIRYKTAEIQWITEALNHDTCSLLVSKIQPLVNDIVCSKNRIIALQETRRRISDRQQNEGVTKSYDHESTDQL